MGDYRVIIGYRWGIVRQWKLSNISYSKGFRHPGLRLLVFLRKCPLGKLEHIAVFSNCIIAKFSPVLFFSLN